MVFISLIPIARIPFVDFRIAVFNSNIKRIKVAVDKLVSYSHWNSGFVRTVVL